MRATGNPWQGYNSICVSQVLSPTTLTRISRLDRPPPLPFHPATHHGVKMNELSFDSAQVQLTSHSPVSCSVSHPVSSPLLFSSLLHFIILIILLSCNREIPSRPSVEPAEELGIRALMGLQLDHCALCPAAASTHGRVRTP